jgi:hypothetical protein
MKSRSDSKLKLLPEDMQEAIMTWAHTAKTEEHPGGLAYVRQQLAADGIIVSLRAVSEFVSWYGLQRRFAAASSRAQQIEELLRVKRPDMKPEAIREMAQALFTLEAVDSGDAETFVNLEHLKLKQDSAATKAWLEKEKLQIAKQRLLLDKARQQLLRIAEQGLTDANKDGVAALLSELEALGVKE